MKRFTRMLVVTSVLAGGFVVGCAQKKDFPVVQAFGPEAPQAVTTAPMDGDYLLFRGAETSPIARTHLSAGAELGFKSDAMDSMGKPVGSPGSVSAVAGELVVPISPAATYEWRHIPKSDMASKKENPFWPRP